MSELAEDNARIEGAFRALFWRAEYAQRADSVDVVCCHANVIRYFVMRALQLPPEAWLRVSLTHASITLLQVRSSGPRHAPSNPNLAAAGAEQRPRHAPHARRLVGPAHRPHHACQRLTLLWALVGFGPLAPLVAVLQPAGRVLDAAADVVPAARPCSRSAAL